MTIRILLVDDQEMIRRGFGLVLGNQPDFTIVGEAENGAAAIDKVRTEDVDVVVMDVRMPHMNGVEATRLICDLERSPKVLILTTFDLDEYVYNALNAGASGFLLKDASTEELASAIRHIHAGDSVVAPSTTRRLLERFSAFDTPSEAATGSGEKALSELTEREHDVVRLVSEGLSNSEIADRLVLSVGTVKVHVSNIITKLGVRDRVQIVVAAFNSGLVKAPEN